MKLFQEVEDFLLDIPLDQWRYEGRRLYVTRQSAAGYDYLPEGPCDKFQVRLYCRADHTVDVTLNATLLTGGYAQAARQSETFEGSERLGRRWDELEERHLQLIWGAREQAQRDFLKIARGVMGK